MTEIDATTAAHFAGRMNNVIPIRPRPPQASGEGDTQYESIRSDIEGLIGRLAREAGLSATQADNTQKSVIDAFDRIMKGAGVDSIDMTVPDGVTSPDDPRFIEAMRCQGEMYILIYTKLWPLVMFELLRYELFLAGRL